MVGNLKKGDKIGNYSVVEVLNRGGMAWVVKVHDPQNKLYALKVSMNNDVARINEVAIRKETELLQKFQHPNIVRVFPISEALTRKNITVYHAKAHNLPDTPWYYAMEFLAGGTVLDYLKKMGRLTPGQAANIAGHVTLGLYELHKEGYSHNDVKASNIMFRDIVKPGQRYTPVLVDFGIITPLDSPNTQAASIHIMPPEIVMLSGGAKLLKPETMKQFDAQKVDIWSIGILMYQLLTSALPFPAFSGRQMTTQIINNSPKSIRTINPDVSEDLEFFILKACLATKPEHRPSLETALDYLYELGGGDKGLPTQPPQKNWFSFLNWFSKK